MDAYSLDEVYRFRRKRARDCTPSRRRVERPRPSIRDFDVQLYAFHDALMHRVFAPNADDGTSESVDQTDVLQLTHSMRLIQWKMQCCLDPQFNTVVPYREDQWNFISKLQLNEHELIFCKHDRNYEWVRVTIPWIVPGQPPNSYEPAELYITYDFSPFFMPGRNYNNYDEWEIRWESGYPTQAASTPTASHVVTLLKSSHGFVTVCDESNWKFLFERSMGISLSQLEHCDYISSLSISFIIRFLGRLCSANGRNPAEDIHRRYEKKLPPSDTTHAEYCLEEESKNDTTAAAVSVKEQPHAFYSNVDEFYFPFLTEWWRDRRQDLIQEIRDLNVRHLIPELIRMILDHAYEIAPLPSDDETRNIDLVISDHRSTWNFP